VRFHQDMRGWDTPLFWQLLADFAFLVYVQILGKMAIMVVPVCILGLLLSTDSSQNFPERYGSPSGRTWANLA